MTIGALSDKQIDSHDGQYRAAMIASSTALRNRVLDLLIERTGRSLPAEDIAWREHQARAAITRGVPRPHVIRQYGLTRQRYDSLAGQVRDHLKRQLERKAQLAPISTFAADHEGRIVAEAVAEAFHVDFATMVSRTSARAFTLPRMVAMTIMVERGHSTVEVGSWFGRDHSSVWSAVYRVRKVATPQINALIAEHTRDLADRPSA